MRSICAILVLAASLALSNSHAIAAELAWPPTTNETKPWSRWWWLGSISTEDGLQKAMEEYAAAGLGGLEITPIYGVRGYEDQFIQFLSPQWVDRLSFVLKQGKRLGLGIDMNHGTGWPMGGPWVTPDDTCKYVTHKTYTVKAGESLSEPIAMSDAGMVAFAGKKRVPLSELKEPFGENKDLQEMAIDNLRMPGPLKLVAVMAYPENKGKPLNLTDKVAANGTLDWSAPTDSGNWTLYAMFQGLHSRMVKRAAPGDEGHVPDHFSADAMRHYFARFDEALKGQDLSGFRAFFNDSYEVDDGTRGEANFTPKFFEEFQRRRGYDLREHLPALFATQPSDETNRVLCDYRETISDLLLDNFTGEWHKWAAKYGKLVRNQSHGSPANILDLYAAVDIPETEGFGGLTDELKERVSMMYASSAAHITGKPLASSETCTWLDDHFLTTLGHAKQRVDQTLLAGINHIFYHGTTYSPPDAPWPGFLFYAAVEFDPTNSWWDDFPALNKYIERCQSFLQAGQPDNDVLLYAPFYDRWMERGNAAMPHFKIGGSFPGQDVGQQLLKAGYTFDFVSDRQLEDVDSNEGRFWFGDFSKPKASYRAIVVPPTTYMPVKTLEKLIELARNSSQVVFLGALPSDVPGWANLNERRAKLKEALRISENAATSGDHKTIRMSGRGGRIVIGSDPGSMLSSSTLVRPEKLAEHSIQFIRKCDGVGRSQLTYFLVNRGSSKFDDEIDMAPMSGSKQHVAFFDPMTGHFGEVPSKSSVDGSRRVRLALAPGQSLIVVVSRDDLTGPEWIFYRPSGDVAPISGMWTVGFVKGGPELPAEAKIEQLESWTKFAGEPGKAFSGMAKYSITLAKPQAKGDAYRLDLGRVADSCRVSLNGEELGTLIAPPFQIDIPADKLKEQNTLEVFVSNLMANRIADMDRRGVQWKKFYNTNIAARDPADRGRDGYFSAANWTLRESGLLGPVTITPLEKFDPLKEAR